MRYAPFVMAEPAVGVWPSVASNEIAPVSIGLPSSVMVPVMVSVESPPQPRMNKQPKTVRYEHFLVIDEREIIRKQF